MIRLRSALLDVEAELRPEWLTMPLRIRGAHRALIVLASYHAEGGRLAGCRRWSMQRWHASVGFHPKLLATLERHELVRWDGDDLVVAHYIANHEKRIRGLITIQCPLMWAARGITPPGIPPNTQGGSGGTSVRKPSDRTPTYNPLSNGLTPDRSEIHAASNSVSQPLRRKTSEPPGPSGKGSRSRQQPGRSSGPARPSGLLASRLEHREPVQVALPTDGPEGFERWARTMPVVRRPRSQATAKRWRDENLAYWARYDLEPETGEILEELERRKASELWRTPRFIPSPINFLRAASWRGRPRPAVEVFEPTSWQPPAETRAGFRAYLASLADGKALS